MMLLTLAREKQLYHRCQSSLESFAKTPLLISRTQRLKICENVSGVESKF